MLFVSKVGIYSKKLSDEDSRPDACETHVRGLCGPGTCVVRNGLCGLGTCVVRNGLCGVPAYRRRRISLRHVSYI
jgi:hypothetical protein